MLHRHLFASRSWFPDHIRSCGSGLAQKEVVAGCGFDTCQCASVRFVMFCANILSDGLQCVSVLLSVVVKEINNSDCMSSLVFLLLVGVVLAPILVTTLVSSRYSLLRVWSERTTHCSDKPRTWSIQRCPPLPLFHPASCIQLTDRKMFFR